MDRVAPLAFCALLAACGQGLEGQLLDAADDAPIPDASVTLRWSGWGTSDGQIVWDAPKSETTTTGANGRFSFSKDGGTAIAFAAPDRAVRQYSVCSAAAPYRIGGPHDGADFRKVEIDQSGHTDFGATITGWQGSPTIHDTPITVRAPGGVAFVSGGGEIPRVPAAFDTQWQGNWMGCGFLFVRQSSGEMSVIRLGFWFTKQEPGQDTVVVLDVATLGR